MRDAPLHYAGFWRRLGAFALDALLFTALTAPIRVALFGRAAFAGPAGIDLAFLAMDLLLDWLLPSFAILWCWQRWGATPGKWLMEIQVLDARTLQPPTWRQGALRLLGYLVSAALFYLGFLWIAFDRRKQGLHDKLAATVVVRRAPDLSQQPLARLMEGWP